MILSYRWNWVNFETIILRPYCSVFWKLFVYPLQSCFNRYNSITKCILNSDHQWMYVLRYDSILPWNCTTYNYYWAAVEILIIIIVGWTIVASDMLLLGDTAEENISFVCLDVCNLDSNQTPGSILKKLSTLVFGQTI